MQELTYCHPPPQERTVCSCTDREKQPFPMNRVCCWWSGDWERGKALLLPVTHTASGMPQEISLSAPWLCTPTEIFSCFSKAGYFMPSWSPSTYEHLKRAQGQLEICPTFLWSQGHRGSGPGPSMGRGRRRCASLTFGLMKTSATSETFFVLSGIVI